MTKIDKATRELLADPAKRRAWVIYQLQLQGRALASVAADHSVSRQCIYSAFSAPYPRMEKLIAEALDLTPQQVFPERYDSDGLPARKKGRPRKISCRGQHNRAKSKRNTQSRVAA